MAPGKGLGLGSAAGCPLGLGGRLAAVLVVGWVVGVGFVGAWALAAAGLLAVGAGFEARLGGVPRGLGGGVLDEDVVVVVDEVVVVVEVVESEAEERAVGDGRGSWASGRAYDAGSRLVGLVKDSEDATSKHRSLTGTPMPESVTTRCNKENYTARCGGHPQSAQPRLGEYDIGTIIRENTHERVDAVGAIDGRCINGCIGVYR